MNFIIWLVIGGLIGWLASLAMKANARQGLLFNVLVGAIGSIIGGWWSDFETESASVNQAYFDISSLLASLIGALILLGIANLFRSNIGRY